MSAASNQMPARANQLKGTVYNDSFPKACALSSFDCDSAGAQLSAMRTKG